MLLMWPGPRPADLAPFLFVTVLLVFTPVLCALAGWALGRHRSRAAGIVYPLAAAVMWFIAYPLWCLAYWGVRSFVGNLWDLLRLHFTSLRWMPHGYYAGLIVIYILFVLLGRYVRKKASDAFDAGAAASRRRTRWVLGVAGGVVLLFLLGDLCRVEYLVHRTTSRATLGDSVEEIREECGPPTSEGKWSGTYGRGTLMSYEYPYVWEEAVVICYGVVHMRGHRPLCPTLDISPTVGIRFDEDGMLVEVTRSRFPGNVMEVVRSRRRQTED